MYTNEGLRPFALLRLPKSLIGLERRAILTAAPRQHKLRSSFSLRKSSPLRCASSSPKSLSGFSGSPKKSLPPPPAALRRRCPASFCKSLTKTFLAFACQNSLTFPLCIYYNITDNRTPEAFTPTVKLFGCNTALKEIYYVGLYKNIKGQR